MSEPLPTDYNPRKRWMIYVAAALVFVLLLVIMEPLFTTHSANDAAKNKAKELNSALSSAGLTTFDVDDIARVLGTDGGAVCTDPAGALKKAEQKGLFTNGAAGPGQRPVITDENLLKGAYLIVETYCPENRKAFEEFVSSLKLDNVVRK